MRLAWQRCTIAIACSALAVLACRATQKCVQRQRVHQTRRDSLLRRSFTTQTTRFPLIDVSSRQCHAKWYDHASAFDVVDVFNASHVQTKIAASIAPRNDKSRRSIASWTPRSVKNTDWRSTQRFRDACFSHENVAMLPYWNSTPYVMVMQNAAFQDPDAFYDCRTRLTYHKMCNCCDAPRSAALTGNTLHFSALVVMNSAWSGNVYHFVIEALSRLAVALQTVPKHQPVTVLAPQGPGYINEFLSLLKVPFITAVANTTYVADLMYVPSFVGCGFPLPEHIRELRRLIFNALDEPLVMNRDKHVVVIKRGGGRSVSNHDELLVALKAALPTEAFVEARFEQLPVLEQIKVMWNAKGVVAPHGAGLSNMIFTQEHVPIIELVPQHYDNGCYCHLARVMNRPWWGVVVPNAGEFDTMTVDVGDVVTTVKAAMLSM